jgi:DNA-binding Xre family transcriptional regulator
MNHQLSIINRLMLDKNLRELMESAGIRTWKELIDRTKMSRGELRLLRRGDIGEIKLSTIYRIAAILNCELSTVLSWHKLDNLPELPLPPEPPSPPSENERKFQQQALTTLESLITYLPTIVAKVQTNPELSANRILPILKPLDNLLEQWEVTPLGTVGEIVPFQPHIHQPMNGNIAENTAVIVRFIGYRHRGKLLFRARVNPVN